MEPRGQALPLRVRVGVRVRVCACARVRVCVCVRGGAGGKGCDLQVRVDEAFGRGEVVEQPARRAHLRVQDASPQAMARAGGGTTRASQGPHGRLRGGVRLLSAGPAAAQRRPSRRAVPLPGSRLGHAAWAVAWAVARPGRWRGQEAAFNARGAPAALRPWRACPPRHGGWRRR